MSRSRTLILKGLLWLIDREQARIDGQGGPWNEYAPGRVLAREIQEELESEEAEADSAREVLLASRRSEEVPVQNGKLKEKEKEHGGAGTEG